MHMTDALVSPVVGGSLYIASAAMTAYSIKKIDLEENRKLLPTMGVMGAFVFAAQMINFTIPGTGSSGHLCGSMLLAAVLGPCSAFITMVGVLLVQCLLFADGGILALGCNIWNMAFYGCFVGGLLIWKFMMAKQPNKKGIIAASIIGSVISMQLGAFSVVLETYFSGVTKIPFKLFVATMQPIHLAIGVVEGLITASILVFIYSVRPEILWMGNKNNDERASTKKLWIFVVIATVIVAGVVSHFASENPDGLEWSIEKTLGSNEVKDFADDDSVSYKAQQIQKKAAVLPDYNFKENANGVGTSTSGLVGASLILIGFVCIACGLKLFIKKGKRADE